MRKVFAIFFIFTLIFVVGNVAYALEGFWEADIRPFDCYAERTGRLVRMPESHPIYEVKLYKQHPNTKVKYDLYVKEQHVGNMFADKQSLAVDYVVDNLFYYPWPGKATGYFLLANDSGVLYPKLHWGSFRAKHNWHGWVRCQTEVDLRPLLTK